VSVATVSRLVNGTGNVGADSAARITQAIQELGFRPNVVGRSLKMARTRSLGVVIPSISNPVFAETLAGLSAEARASDYNLMLTVSDYDCANEAGAVSALMSCQVDGLILTVADLVHSASLDMLDAAGIPYVLVYNQPSDGGRPTIGVDNIAAGGDVARALAALGHRRLGMIAGSFQASDRSRARQTGFVREVLKAGIDAPVIREVDFVDGDIEQVVTGLFEGDTPPPAALFCSNDLLAISVIGALRRAQPDRATLLFMHHPPFQTGIGHMDVQNLINADELLQVLSHHSQIRHIACGHIHRAVDTVIGGIAASIGPNAALAVTLDLAPDAPSSFTLEPPMVRLFRFADGHLVSHLSHVGSFDGPHPFFAEDGSLID